MYALLAKMRSAFEGAGAALQLLYGERFQYRCAGGEQHLSRLELKSGKGKI